MPESLGLVLWLVVALLMIGGTGAVLAFTFRQPSFPADRPTGAIPEAIPKAIGAMPVKPVDPEVLASRKAAHRQGLFVLIGLGALTAVEYAVAVLLEGSAGLLFVLILAKAGVIIQYYMHLNSVWGEETHS